MDQILEILEDNARISNEELAKLTGIDAKEVDKAIKAYEKKGIIVKYKTVINKEKVKGTKTVVAIIEVKVTPQKDVGFDLIAERIFRFPECSGWARRCARFPWLRGCSDWKRARRRRPCSLACPRARRR